MLRIAAATSTRATCICRVQGRFQLQQFGVASGVAKSVFGAQEFRMT